MANSADINAADRVIVVGAGLAGLFTALRLAPLPVLVLSPVPLGGGASSGWAQGGVAAALGEGDSPEAHAADTVAAGAGLVDPIIARLVAEEAPARIEDLLRIGAPFDRDARGRLVQSREAAHSAARVCRVKGDTAGAAIMAAVMEAVRAVPSIEVRSGLVAEELLRDGSGTVRGVLARTSAGQGAGRLIALSGRAVVLATGGVGGLFADTSNPSGVVGQGLGMAARAGARVRDPEFVQFHPTGLAVDRDPVPLASEALRGEGSVLIDETGARVMEGVHPDSDLAPRDVVTRALHRHIRTGHSVFLDTRAAIGRRIDAQFPTIAAACREAGIDPASEPIPVRPIQHYHMGGLATDADARTSLPGLWAVGEVACTGLHGANRLASNSLLEALVFGARAACSVAACNAPAGPVDLPPPLAGRTASPAGALWLLRAAMTAQVGVERDARGLSEALGLLARLESEAGGAAAPRPLLNATSTATLIAAGALCRRESRGGHFRSDHPAVEPTWAAPTLTTLAEARAIRAEAAGALAA